MKEYEKLLQELQNEIDNFDIRLEAKDYGIVKSVGDGIAIIDGLSNSTLGEMVQFDQYSDEPGIGMVMGIQQSCVQVMFFNKIYEIKEGTKIFATGKQFSTPCGKQFMGRVIDALGNPIDGLGPIQHEEYRTIEAPSPGIMERKTVNESLQTGIKKIDAIFPLGHGQKQLILGDRQTGKTSLVIQTILHQKKLRAIGRKFAHCIYVAIGKKCLDIAMIYEKLKKHDAMEYTTIVTANASDPASMQYIAPMVGATLAENWRDHGMDVLVAFDDLSKHADAYREISLLMRRPPARGAYPGDSFYLHSRLLERATNMAKGGSVSMLPILETTNIDFISTNVISITDGQLVMQKELMHKNLCPAINIALSVSRIGSAAQCKAMKSISGHLKTELAQYEDYKSFLQSSTEISADIQAVLRRGKMILQLLQQNATTTLLIDEMLLSLFGCVNGLFDKIDIIEEIEQFERKLYEYMQSNHQDILDKINKTLSIDIELNQKLKLALRNFCRDNFLSESINDHLIGSK
jgi:F-type H+-transporting ATPase subunit alpha